MKTRILSGLIAFILLLGVMLLGREVFGIAIFLLSWIGIYEFYKAMSGAGYKPVKLLGYIACLALPVVTFGTAELANLSLQPMALMALAVFALMVSSFCLIIFKHHQYSVVDISLTVFGILYVVFLFSFVILTRNLADGKYLIWLVLIGAWATDTFAYFTGMAFGKTKILPAVSPKKSLEGSIGGVIGCMLVTGLYGLYLRDHIAYISFYHYIILGGLSGVISQIGDWAASAVKRNVNIKDYGKLMPGHGGVLDRLDSILFVAPVVYFYILWIIQ